MLTKLQVLFDLPSRLRQCMDMGAYASAVHSYAAAAPLLERYGGKGGALAGVQGQVQGSVKELGERLRAQLRDQSTRPDDAAEALELLQALRLPQDELQRDWLSERRAALTDALAAAQAAWPPSSGEASDWVARLDAAFLGELSATSTSYRELFPDSRTALVELGRTMCSDYFRIVKDSIAPPGGIVQEGRGTVSGPALMGALHRMVQDVAPLARLVPELRLNDRAAEVVEGAVRRHVCAAFAAVEADAARQLEATLAQLHAAPDAGAADTHDSLLRTQARVGASIMEGLHAALRDVAALQGERPALLGAWKEVFVDLVQGQCALLFTGVVNTCIAACRLPPMPEAAASLAELQHAAPEAPKAPPGKPAELPPPVFVLFLLRLCGDLDARVPPVAERMQASFTEGMRGGFDAAGVQRLLRQAGNTLLVGYVQQQGRRLSKLVRKSMAVPEWLVWPEPIREVRPVCDAILGELAVVEKQVAHLLPMEAGGAKAAAATGPAGGAGGDRIHRNVAKLFQEKLRVFDDVEPTRTSVMLGIIKIALKSWVECVRQVTLSRSGYHQLLLDVHYMRKGLRMYTFSNPSVAEGLLDDIAAAAADRCAGDPVGLGESDMDTILGARQQGKSI